MQGTKTKQHLYEIIYILWVFLFSDIPIHLIFTATKLIEITKIIKINKIK